MEEKLMEAEAVEATAEAAAEAPVEETPKKKAKAKKAAPSEPTYTVKELASAYKRLGTRPECVTAAMRVAGKEEATLTEAKKLVEAFLKRKVGK